jgi:hypothetical protein
VLLPLESAATKGNHIDWHAEVEEGFEHAVEQQMLSRGVVWEHNHQIDVAAGPILAAGR